MPSRRAAWGVSTAQFPSRVTGPAIKTCPAPSQMENIEDNAKQLNPGRESVTPVPRGPACQDEKPCGWS